MAMRLAWHSHRQARELRSLQTQALGHPPTHPPTLHPPSQHHVTRKRLSAGEPIEVSLRNKFGPNAPALMQRVVGAGRQDGVQFANWKWRANTVKGACLGGLRLGCKQRLALACVSVL